MQEAFIWLLLIELFGLAAWPLAFQVFCYLPERGLSLAKPLGLLVAGWLVWLLSMLGLPFNAALCWLSAAVLFTVVDGWLLLRQGRRLGRAILAWTVNHKGLIVLAELIFVAAYIYLVNLRSYMPDIRDQEKFGDYAFLNSLALFDKLPPADPWMSGYPINYYYFSHFLMAMLVKMCGVNPAIAFNLAVPLIFGLTCLGSFGLVYNLVAAAGEKLAGTGRRGSPALFGLLGLLMVAVLGNLDTLRQILVPRSDKGEYTPGNFYFSWWTPSRVIYDYMPQPNGLGGFNFSWSETINEFPMFSFLLADAHPHVMTLPVAILVIGLALNILRSPAGAPAMSLGQPDGRLFLGVTALAAGGLYFLNTWDYPTYLLLVLGAAGLRIRLTGQKYHPENGRWRTPFNRWLGWSAGLVGLSLALYLPFHLTFVSLLGDNQVPEPIASLPVIGSIAKTISFVAWDRTPLLGYLLVFGIFIFPLVSFLVLKLWPYIQQPYGYYQPPDRENLLPVTTPAPKWGYGLTGIGLSLLLLSEIAFYFLKLNSLFTLMLAVVAAPLVAAGFASIAWYKMAVYRVLQPARLLLAVTGGLAALMVAGGWIVRFELYGPLIIAGVAAVLLLWFESGAAASSAVAIPGEAAVDRPVEDRSAPVVADLFVLSMVMLGVLLTFGTELIIIRDVFNSRLNTVFKFYYQAWVLFGLAAAYATWRVAAWAWKTVPFDRLPAGQSQTVARLETVPALTGRLALNPVGAGAGSYQTRLFEPAGLSWPASGGGFTREDELEDPEAEEADDYLSGHVHRSWWRWLWALAIGLLLLAGLIYPIFGPYEKTGHYAQRVGLDGSLWLRDGGATGPAMRVDYKAIAWLQNQIKASPNFAGTILETSGPDWVDYSRVSTFTGLPTLMGWLGHENQWRGGKAPVRADVFDCGVVMARYKVWPPRSQPGQQKDEPWCRQQMVDFIYKTSDSTAAQGMLKDTGVRYVFVGSLEQSLSDSGRAPAKNYPPEGLAKFATFMKVIYQQDGVTIYSF